MTEKVSEFTIETVEKMTLPEDTRQSEGTGSNADDSRFQFTVSEESFRFEGTGEVSPIMNLQKLS